MHPDELDALFAALPYPQCIALDEGSPCKLLHSQHASTGWLCDKHYHKSLHKYSVPPMEHNELQALQILGRESRAIAQLRSSDEVPYLDIQGGARCLEGGLE